LGKANLETNQEAILMIGAYTRGVLFVHSAPRALCPHIEWAAAEVLGSRVHLDWTEQPAAQGMMRAETSWVGPAGTGASLASALRGWANLRYEVTEEASVGTDGGRWSHTPDLGIFHAQTDVHGNVVVPEDRIRAALVYAADPARMRRELDLALGEAWDDEIQPITAQDTVTWAPVLDDRWVLLYDHMAGPRRRLQKYVKVFR